MAMTTPLMRAAARVEEMKAALIAAELDLNAAIRADDHARACAAIDRYDALLEPYHAAQMACVDAQIDELLAPLAMPVH
jgi:hypothetical protein